MPAADIAYARTGSGPPLVLVHGITESRRTWDPLVPALAERFDVVAVDLRGHGESAKVPPFDVGTLAEDVAELTAALGLERPHLIGHSLGGVVVTAMAAAVEPADVTAPDRSQPGLGDFTGTSSPRGVAWASCDEER
jgi:pimeloyl-ACP methyl ester carboxylesterase